MKKIVIALLSTALLSTTAAYLGAHNPQRTLVVTMTNDPNSNSVIVIDAATHIPLQSISTNGKGGVGGNARGVKEYEGQLLAAVNYGSGTVALFRRAGERLVFEQLVVTTSPPVSVDFGNDHMYVAGAHSVDSFIVFGTHVGRMDGTAQLTLADGGIPDDGATAQVGVVDQRTLIVTIKTDPIPGTVDVIHLRNGAIVGTADAVPAPTGTLTPFGFSVYPDGTALITLAHSGHNALFRNGKFAAVVDSTGQAGNCWTTLAGKYVFIVNTGSRTISRVVGTGSNVFADAAVAARIVTGGSPTDVDAGAGHLAVIDHIGGMAASSHLTLFTYNEFGELSQRGESVDLGAAAANGIAIMSSERERDTSS